jgi:hypothetical protein
MDELLKKVGLIDKKFNTDRVHDVMDSGTDPLLKREHRKSLEHRDPISFIKKAYSDPEQPRNSGIGRRIMPEMDGRTLSANRRSIRRDENDWKVTIMGHKFLDKMDEVKKDLGLHKKRKFPF